MMEFRNYDEFHAFLMDTLRCRAGMNGSTLRVILDQWPDLAGADMRNYVRVWAAFSPDTSRPIKVITQ